MEQHKFFSRPVLLLLLVMVLHVVLANTYSSVLPFRTAGTTNGKRLPDIGSPDEFAHANYVEQLATTGQVPVFDANDPAISQHYENHQPPLYYELEHLLTKPLITEYRSRAAGKWLRVVSSLFGAATVCGVYFIGVWGFGRPKLGLFAAGVTAFLPMLCAIDGSVNNDTLLIALMTWAFAFCVKGLKGWAPGQTVWLALLTGLALWTKTTALVLLPVILAAYFLTPSTGRKAYQLVLALLVPMFLVAPWWMHNNSVYHDPLALGVFQRVFPSDVHISGAYGFGLWGYVLLSGTLLSFVGEFGYMDIHLPYWIYIPTILVLVVAMIGGWKATAFASRPVARLMWVYFVLVLLAYVQFNLVYVQPQARYLFPAIGVIATWIGFGVSRMALRRPNALASMVLIWLLLVNAYALRMLPKAFKVRTAATTAERPMP